MKAPTNTETRLTAEWEPEVRFCRDGKMHAVAKRKLITTDVVERPADNLIEWIIDNGRKGREARLTWKGKGAVRFIPVANRDFKSIGMKSQTMGEFVNALSDLKIKKYEHNGQKITRSQAVEISHEIYEETNDYKRSLVHVTPDMTVTCPECGTEFRVGKVLK